MQFGWRPKGGAPKGWRIASGNSESIPLSPPHLEENIKFTGIKSNSTICNIFKKAFTNAGFEYINPHNFRHTAIRFAETQSPAFLNAVRQSLGHKSIETSFNSYGELSEYDQRERINGLEYDFEQENN